jgi:hypothetical protein
LASKDDIWSAAIHRRFPFANRDGAGIPRRSEKAEMNFRTPNSCFGFSSGPAFARSLIHSSSKHVGQSFAEETMSHVLEKCEVCGNEYDKSFSVSVDGQSHTFDCFECAIHALAPECAHCGCRVIGHGIEHEEAIYCCAHCASMAGVHGAADRV